MDAQAAHNTVPEHHVLVVDDDDKLRELLSQFLTEHGYFVSEAENTRAAEDVLRFFDVDAMVLDVMMPGETGLEFAKRATALPPTLMLTALNESEDRIAGLESGVSDYLAKPFAPKELLLRLANMLRQRPKASQAAWRFGPYVFTAENGQLTQAGEVVYLTGSEQSCLQALAANVGSPISRGELAEKMGDVSNERSVDVQMNRLRKKIEPNPAKPIYIQTVRHAGYVLIAEPV